MTGAPRLGFIGLGDMGLPMARRLLAAEGDLLVWNRSAAKLRGLEAEGATIAASPADLLSRADLVGLCLTSHSAVEEITRGPEGLFAAAGAAQKYVADFSTGSPEAAASFARTARKHNIGWVDAPVSGGVPAAAAGKLIIFAGGDSTAVAALHALFTPLSTTVSHMGGSGAGQVTKLCNQIIVACNLLAMAEAIAMARSAGIDPAVIPAALKGGFADSMPLQIFGPRMAQHIFEPRLGSLALMEKDVVLANAVGEACGANMAMVNLARELFARARQQCHIDPSGDISRLIGLFDGACRTK